MTLNSKQNTTVHSAQATAVPTAGFAHPPRNVAALGIEPGMYVADFGSGSGAYVVVIAEHLEGLGHVYAIDIQKDLLRKTANEAARRGFRVVEVLWGDLEAPGGSKLSQGSMDLVLVSNLIFQVPDKGAVLSEARRVLKSTGRLAIIDWSESFGGMGPVEDAVVRKEDAIALAEKAGFVLAKEFPAGEHHYGLIFRANG